MRILQTVNVNQVLTESSKNQMIDQYNSQSVQMQKEIEQLKFEMKKLAKSKKIQPVSLQTHFERELNNRLEKLKLLAFKLQQLEKLPIGSELKEREVQAIVDVEIGDDWKELSRAKTIVITDGKVTEIR